MADYSRASVEERARVVSVLRRNVDALIEREPDAPVDALRSRLDDLVSRIERGDVITGKAYKDLLSMLQNRRP